MAKLDNVSICVESTSLMYGNICTSPSMAAAMADNVRPEKQEALVKLSTRLIILLNKCFTCREYECTSTCDADGEPIQHKGRPSKHDKQSCRCFQCLVMDDLHCVNAMAQPGMHTPWKFIQGMDEYHNMRRLVYLMMMDEELSALAAECIYYEGDVEEID
eukprot:scpid105259/ scgid28180/ 